MFTDWNGRCHWVGWIERVGCFPAPVEEERTPRQPRARNGMVYEGGLPRDGPIQPPGGPQGQDNKQGRCKHGGPNF